MLSPQDFFDKDNPIFDEFFSGSEFVWDGLKNISAYIKRNIKPNLKQIPKNGPLVLENVKLDNGALVYAGACIMDENIEIGPGSVIEPGALIYGPAIIGTDTRVRQAAYIRGNVITGSGCVIGHATEIKNSIMLRKSKAGHFAYIGDSILGTVNLGAGTKLANLKIIDSQVVVKIGKKQYNTGLRKFGAILGDGAETGCNSVTSPGTILSRNVLVYPNTTARGYYPPGTIVKLRQNINMEEKK
jgi:NDP-sugar pyrophosphorylase family protein